MMNPFVVDNLAHMRHEELQREIKQDRLIKTLPGRRSAKLVQVAQSLAQAFKIRAPRSRVENVPCQAGAEC